MKTIYYQTLKTQATTNYRRISAADRQWIIDNLDALLSVLSVSEACREPSLAEPNLYFNKPRSDLPRHNRGPERFTRNSLASFARGVVENFSDHQRDPSDRTCDGLTVVFAEAEQWFTCFESVKFVEGTAPAPVIKPGLMPAWRRLIELEQGTLTIEYQPK